MINKIGLSLTNLRRQNFNETANISDQFINAQAYILKHQPIVTYVHYYRNCLNLVLVETCLKHPVQNTVEVIEEVTNFNNNSPKKLEFLKSKLKKNWPNL